MFIYTNLIHIVNSPQGIHITKLVQVCYNRVCNNRNNRSSNHKNNRPGNSLYWLEETSVCEQQIPRVTLYED